MRIQAILAGALLLAPACGGGDETGAGSGGSITIAGQQANDHGTETVSAAAELDLELDDFFFAPTVLSGTAGQVLSLRLSNRGAADHTFTAQALGVDIVVAAGEETSTRVSFPASGAIVFECRFHAGQGMRGGLSVAGSLDATGDGVAPGDLDDTGDTGGGYGYG